MRMGVALLLEQSVQNRTPVLLIFSVSLPSVEARGRWKERRRIGTGRLWNRATP
jgi:hypothetical protein